MLNYVTSSAFINIRELVLWLRSSDHLCFESCGVVLMRIRIYNFTEPDLTTTLGDFSQNSGKAFQDWFEYLNKRCATIRTYNTTW